VSDLKIFSLEAGGVKQLQSSDAPIEKSLQNLMEANLEALLGIRFLETEYSTGRVHGGRIDTLGIDENGCPVIIEYKRSTNENVINQGLFYLDWLMDHQAEFKLMVMDKLGQEIANSIEWSGPRLLCIAGGFTRYDEYAVKQINRNIELLQYSYFEGNLLTLELVNATQATQSVSAVTGSSAKGQVQYKQFCEYLEQSDQSLKDLFDAVDAYCMNLGDDVQVKTLKFYQAYKRIKNFVCAEVRPQLHHALLYLKVDPETVALENGFTRDVSSVGHFGTGDLEVTITSLADLKKAEPLIVASYEAS
jgi:predicted transport protein